VFHLSFFAWWQQVLFVAAALLAVLGGWFADSKFGDSKTGATVFLAAVAAAGLAAVSFVLFSEKFMLLGDGRIRIGTIGGRLFDDATELGDIFIHRLLYRILAGPGFTGQDIYRWVSIAAGWIFVAVSLLWSVRLPRPWPVRTSIFLLIMGSGALMLFYGHPESYALFNCTVLVFAISCADHDHSLARALLVSAACLAAAFLHLAGLCLVPALIIVWAQFVKKTWLRLAWIGLSSCAVIALGLFIFISVSRVSALPVLLPLIPSAEHPYAVLSGGHIVDMMNLFLLVAAVPVIMLMCSYARDIFEQELSLIAAVAASVLFIFLVDIFFEAGDWDLMAFISLPLGVLAAQTLMLQGLRKPLRIAGIIAGIMCFHTAPWVISNAVPSIALRQYAEVALRYHHKDSDWLFVRGTYILTSDPCRQYREARTLGNVAVDNGISDARIYYNLLIASYHLEDYDQAVKYGQAAVASDSTYTRAWHYLGESYNYLKDHDRAAAAFDKALALGDTVAETYYGLGYALQSMGRYREASNALSKALERSPEEIRYLKMAFYNYYLANDHDQAMTLIEKVLRLSPGDQEALHYRSMILSGTH
jgi:hypothetical protein